MNAVIAVMPVMPRPTPKSAVSTGRPAATSEPKVRIRTSSATAMPISSDLPPTAGWACVPEPLASTVRPSARASAIVSLSVSMVAGLTSATVSTSKFQLIVPTRPSCGERRERPGRWPSLDGGVPLLALPSIICCVCGAAASTGLASGGVVGHLRQCGEVRDEGVDGLGLGRLVELWPFGAATTTFTEAWSKASADPGNSSDWRSAAFSEGMPGIEKASLIGLDRVAATVATAIMAPARRRRRTASAGRRSCRGGRAALPWVGSWAVMWDRTGESGHAKRRRSLGEVVIEQHVAGPRVPSSKVKRAESMIEPSSDREPGPFDVEAVALALEEQRDEVLGHLLEALVGGGEDPGAAVEHATADDHRLAVGLLDGEQRLGELAEVLDEGAVRTAGVEGGQRGRRELGDGPIRQQHAERSRRTWPAAVAPLLPG